MISAITIATERYEARSWLKTSAMPQLRMLINDVYTRMTSCDEVKIA